MNSSLSQTDIQKNKAIDVIKNSFKLIDFSREFFESINRLILDDVHLNAVELEKIGWCSIFSLDNSGALDGEKDELVNWLKCEKIS